MSSPVAAPVAVLNRRHIMVAIGAASTTTAGSFQYVSIGFVNPPLAATLDVPLSDVMLFNSLMALAGVVSMTFLAPYLYRTIGVRRVMIAGGAVAASGLALVPHVTSLPMLYGLAVAIGTFFGSSTAMAAALLVNTWFERSRGAVMGGVFAFGGVGGVTAGLVIPSVVKSSGWEGGFLLTAIVTAVVTVGSGIFLVRSTPQAVGLLPYGAAPSSADEGLVSGPLPGVPAKVAMRSAPFWALVIATVFFGAFQQIQQHFAPMAAGQGVSVNAAGTLMSLMALVGIFGNILTGTLSDRRGVLTAVLAVTSAQVVAMLGFAFFEGLIPLGINLSILAISGSFWIMTPIVVMQIFGPRDFSTLLGPVSAAGPAGMALGSPLWGLVREQTGSYDLMLFVSAIGTVLIMVAFAWALNSRLRDRYEP